MAHFHVTRHSEDEDPYITEDKGSALDYASTELAELGDSEHDLVITIAMQVEEGQDVHPDTMADALKSQLKAERYWNWSTNTGNHAKFLNPDTPDSERAPLYQDGDVDGKTAEERRNEGADWVISQVNNETPMHIWECLYATGTYPDEDRENAGALYCTHGEAS